MAQPKRIAQGIVGLVQETTSGTFVEPAAANSFFARNITLPERPEPHRRNDTRNHFGKSDNVPNKAGLVEIGFEIDLVGAASAGAAPYWKDLLLACGLREELTSASKADYKPWTTFDAATGAGPPAFRNPKDGGYSVAVWEDGLRYAIKGAMGNLVISGEGAKICMAQFTFRGAYEAIADDATPPTGVNPSALTPITLLTASMSLHAVATLALHSFKFDLGNEIVPLSDAQKANYDYAARIKDRRPLIEIVSDMTDVAAFDWAGKHDSQATGAFDIGRLGSVTGNRFTLDVGRVQIAKYAFGDREGGRMVTATLDPVTLNNGTEGSELTLTFD